MGRCVEVGDGEVGGEVGVWVVGAGTPRQAGGYMGEAAAAEVGGLGFFDAGGDEHVLGFAGGDGFHEAEASKASLP